MKLKKWLQGCFPLAALVFELLPNGVILRFMNPDGDPWVTTYSYFDLLPFGYANFGPLLTAILTCVLVVLVAILFFKETKGVLLTTRIVAGLAAFTSFLPRLMLGSAYYSTIGMTITLLLLATAAVTFSEK